LAVPVGIVEADKAFIGGHDKKGHDDKAIILGMVERDGDVIARVIPDRKDITITPIISEHVYPGSRIATDAATAFMNLAASVTAMRA